MGGKKKKGKAKCEFQLGDLVLARVKGYPAWPAQIGNPDDWDKPTDPRKHFVEFFGTGEIAFVAPADIQVFTEETKAKLLSRCQSKKTKSFVQAVEEICAAFDELNQNSTGTPTHDTSPPEGSNAAVNSHSENKVTKSEEGEVKSKNENDLSKCENNAVVGEIEGLKSEEKPINKNSDELHKLEHCSVSSSTKTVPDDLSSKKNAGKSSSPGASAVVKKKRILDKVLAEGSREVKKKDVDEKTEVPDEKINTKKEARKRPRSPANVEIQSDGKEVSRDETTLVKRTKHLPISEMKSEMLTSDGSSSKQAEIIPVQLEEKKESRKENSIKPKVPVTSEENQALSESHKGSLSGVKNSTKKSLRENENTSSSKVAPGKVVCDSSITSPKKTAKARSKIEEPVEEKKSLPPDKSELEGSVELTKESKSAAAVEAKKSQPHISPSKTLGKSSKGTGEKKKVLSKQEELKSTTSKPRPQPTLAPENRSVNNFPAECTMERDPLLEERDRMKHLIAVAQAVRKQVHSHGPSITIPASLSMPHGVYGTSSGSPQFFPFPHPESAVQGIKSMRISPRLDSSAANPVDPEHLHVPSPVYRPSIGSVSCRSESDEAAAKELFEGALEALTRTKDSIGRATRQAMECAKFGITNEIMEHLLSKMEIEPSFHRRVDLLFLVDSITQCSNVQKGFAGESFIQTVQLVLPRLLTAAAPAGAAGRENRRQCLKVLRLWMERKIMPESLLKKCIADIKNEDPVVDFSSMRRPTRAERNIDDPIRDLEDDFLVDEYGSNATIDLPGLLTSNFFEEEDEEPPINNPSNGNMSNGELETKDVSPLSKELESPIENPSPIPGSQHDDNPSTTYNEEPPLTGASKTMPDDQDPVPPLAGEPPLSPPPPPPPPPTNSPPQPPPLPPSPPPSPPPPVSLQESHSPPGEEQLLPPPPPPPPLPPGPPPMQVQSAVPPPQMQQSLETSQALPPPAQPPLPPGPPPMQLKSSSVVPPAMPGPPHPAAVPSAAPPSAPPPYFMNQHGPGNTPMRPPNFTPNGPCNTGPGYCQNNMHLPPPPPQMPGPNYPFQQGNMPFHQGPPQPPPPNQPYMQQPPCNIRPFPDSCHGPYPPDSYHGPYPMDCFRGPCPPDGYPHGLFPPDGFRGPPFPPDGGFCGPFPPDHGYPGPFPPEVGFPGPFPPDGFPGPFPPDGCPPPDGYFRPNMERPPFDHRHPMQNQVPPGPPHPDHFHPQMLPCRPDNPAHNNWRPG